MPRIRRKVNALAILARARRLMSPLSLTGMALECPFVSQEPIKELFIEDVRGLIGVRPNRYMKRKNMPRDC